MVTFTSEGLEEMAMTDTPRRGRLLVLYFIGGGVLAAYVASMAAKSMFGPLL